MRRGRVVARLPGAASALPSGSAVTVTDTGANGVVGASGAAERVSDALSVEVVTPVAGTTLTPGGRPETDTRTGPCESLTRASETGRVCCPPASSGSGRLV